MRLNVCIYVELPAPGENAVLNWQKALKQAIEYGADEICFHPGKYEFFPEDCTEKFLYFSNNDKGIKTVALHLDGLKNMTIRGKNTELFFHGRISPVVAENCNNLQLEGFTIDFEDSFVSDGCITDSGNGVSYLKIQGKHSFSDGKIHFCGDKFDNLSGELHIRPYLPRKGEMPWDANVTVVKNKDLQFKDGLVSIPCELPAGNVLIKHEERLCPGIVLSDCSKITVRDVVIHHAAGMGLLAQFCSDVTFDQVKVIPRGRSVSASDDAMHMVECRGNLRVSNCECAGTLDDSLNVHGIYRPTSAGKDKRHILLGTGHFQQAGFPGARPGDTLEFVKSATGFAYAVIPVISVEQLDENQTLIELAEPLPRQWTPGDCVRVLAPGQAVLEVENCTFSTLRGRGVLASGLESLIVRNCTFHTTGAAVFIAGGCTAWYETGPVRYAIIENNCFDNCCYQRFSSTRETVSVYPDISRCRRNFYYHGEIIVRNNVFISQKRPQIAVFSAEEVCIDGNSFEYNNAYPFDPPPQKVYSFAKKSSGCTIFKQVKNVITDNNTGIY